MDFPEEYKNIIERHGYMVMRVAPYPEGHDRHFAYSIGLWESFNHPEIFVFSFGGGLSEAIVKAISQYVSKGGVVEAGKSLFGFSPSPYFFREIDKGYFEEYLGFAFLRYGFDFKCYQCFLADRNGLFPWDAGYEESFEIESQPNLGVSYPS